MMLTKIDPTDSLPQSICERCLRDVENVKLFIERCRRSDECLRKKLKMSEFNLGKATNDLQVEGENSPVHIIEVFVNNSEINSTDLVENINIDDLITEELFESNDSKSENFDDKSDFEENDTYVNDLIITDPIAQLADVQEPNYTQCCGCVENFVSFEALQEHSRRCHYAEKAISGPNPYNIMECTICYKLFSGVSYLDSMHRLNAFKNRLQSVGFPEVIQCCACDVLASSKEELLHHANEHIERQTYEDTTKPFECQFCFKRYKEKSTLTFHQKFSYSYKKQLVTKRRGCRAVKKRSAIESTTNNRKCCGCFAEFICLDSLKQHSRMHHELYRSQKDDANPFQCEICFKQFPTLIRLEQHRLVPYIREHKCDICEKSFLTPLLYQKHMENHHSNSIESKVSKKASVTVEKNVQCDLCGKTVRNKYQLKAHQKSIHTEEKRFSCSLCSQKFKWKHVLQNHLRVHTKEQPYNCKFCPRKFTQLADKTRHEICHSQDFPLKCSVCGKGFSMGRQKLLEQHEKHHQAGEDYPFTCQCCDRTFTRLTHRDRHQTRHMAERNRSLKLSSEDS
ncbi:zinc finger protein 728-like isoform X2 [Malaya genurostris]|uniref:zinc finger protein 728-like isoform X2 n=1 Tax=Malaya genurostris TaxID=325434 RepID=UPI0026F39880|nr:zinc finger protein 728-like isoform X2 [Malaya genurostris]